MESPGAHENSLKKMSGISGVQHTQLSKRILYGCQVEVEKEDSVNPPRALMSCEKDMVLGSTMQLRV